MAARMNVQGDCSCGDVRYRLTADPLVVHACHCRDCQRIAGSAFVINLWIEGEFVETIAGAPKAFQLPAGSGKPHEVFFCEKCGTYVWSRYHSTPGNTLFVRVGTLDEPDAFTPDVHIFTRSKVPWLVLPSGVPAFEAFYELKNVWPDEKRQRLRAHITKHTSGARS